MKRQSLRLPAISREVEFIGKHDHEATAVYNGAINVDPVTRAALRSIYERANQEVAELLRSVTGQMSASTCDIARIGFPNRGSEWNWGREGPFTAPRKRSRKLGWLGVVVDCTETRMRLVSHVFPRGGLDGRNFLADQCKKKLDGIRVFDDEAERWPGWTPVVFYDIRPIRRTTERDELVNGAGRAARDFLRIAMPYRKELASR